MNCKHCGKAISDSDTICPACGTVTGVLPSPRQTTSETGQNSDSREFWSHMQNQ